MTLLLVFLIAFILFSTSIRIPQVEAAEVKKETTAAVAEPTKATGETETTAPPFSAVLVSKKTGLASSETETRKRKEEGEVQGEPNNTATLPSSIAPVEKNEPSPFISSILTSKEVATTSSGIKLLTKTLSGEIGARGANGIALVYEKDEKKRSSKEMWFPYDGEPKFVGYKSKADVGEGDQVSVTYEEAEDGSKRILTGIKLDKKYEPPKEEDEVEEEMESDGK